MDILNSREIAVLFWLGLFATWALSKSAVRKSLLNVFRALVKWQILLTVLLQVIYIMLVVYALSIIGLWNVSHVKSTILWTSMVAIASIFRVVKSGEDPKLLQAWIEDNLKLVVLIEFMANSYTFHLVVELIFVPFSALLAGMVAFAESRKQYQQVVNILNGVLFIIGAALIVNAMYRIISDSHEFASLQIVQGFYTPPLLSLFLIPFLFVLYIFVSYENAFLRLRWAVPDRRLRAFAKLRAVLAFQHRVELLRRWSRNISVSKPSGKDDIRRSLREVGAGWKRERNPPHIPPTEGWSPYAADGFLGKHGVVTGDYHRSFDEWFACSPYQEIGDALLKDNLAYYVEGDEHTATRLKLILNVNNPTDSTDSDRRFREMARTLLKMALNDDTMETSFQSLLSQQQETLQIGHKSIRLSRENWTGGIRGGYERRLVIEHILSAKNLTGTQPGQLNHL